MKIKYQLEEILSQKEDILNDLNFIKLKIQDALKFINYFIKRKKIYKRLDNEYEIEFLFQ